MIINETITSAAVTTIPLPVMASAALFQNNGTGVIRYCFEADTPTATLGLRLLPGSRLEIGGTPSYRMRGAVKFIAESASCTLDGITDAP